MAEPQVLTTVRRKQVALSTPELAVRVMKAKVIGAEKRHAGGGCQPANHHPHGQIGIEKLWPSLRRPISRGEEHRKAPDKESRRLAFQPI
jgi:hypothetical protein